MAAVVGMRKLDLEAAAGIGLAETVVSAIAGVVDDLDVEAGALVVLAGEAGAANHGNGANATGVRGNGYRRDRLVTLTGAGPAYPELSVTRITGGSPAAVVASD